MGALPDVRREREQLFVGDDVIRVLHERSIDALPWRELGVDVVLDCTGVYGNREHGEAHLAAGAKKVLFSHPVVTIRRNRRLRREPSRAESRTPYCL